MQTKKRKSPSLRFRGYTDDWEERKLRDLLNKNSEKNKNLSVINVESVSNKTGFTKQTDQFEDYSVASADLSNYYVIREKQFAYNPSRINVGSIAYKDLGDEISVVSPLYVSFSTKKVLNDGFLWNWFKTASFDAQRQRLSEGGVRDTLSFNQLSEMNTMFPTYPEQEKIGSFFKQLDNTIALHQRKLDLLKEQKKGFLQKMFPKNGARVPELRFEGFTDDWEERKLGELASFSKGNGYTKNDLVEFGDPIILYGRLYTKYETVIEKVDTFVNKKDNSIISEGSEVIVPASGESSEDISRASVVGKSGLILGGDLNIIKPVNYIDSIFLALTISNGSQRQEMSKRAQGKSVVHLHNSDLKQVNLLYPKLEEQQKIGTFFKQLDCAIALHQRKLDLLKEQKKGFLQKMFV